VVVIEEKKLQSKSDGGGPLQGLKILDLTSVIMGPFATQMLGDMGADVITVETFEWSSNRRMGDGPHEEFSGVALNLLRNKRCISLDMKHVSGRDAVLRIAARCDALVTNLRPKPLARLGLAYEQVAKVKPDIVYCQAQGFRTDTVRADDPAYDDIVQAESGIVDASLRAGRGPSLAPTILADKVCGLTIVNAVAAALLYRARTGESQRIEVPMADVMKSFMLVEHGAGAISVPPRGNVGWERVLSPERGPQRTSDGWINILPYSTEAYDALFTAGNRRDLIRPGRTRPELAREATHLYGEMKKIVVTQTTDYWLEFCSKHGIPVGKIGRLDEIVDSLPTNVHPHAGTYHVIPHPVRFDSTPAGIRFPAPRIGQDGRSILEEVGYSSKEIDELIFARAMKLPS
jgi:crotonobetainyl-CoA:carnitine CoA-transferase CaiB-like acyl-CoA transferase